MTHIVEKISRIKFISLHATDRSAEGLPPLVDVCEGLLERRGRAGRLRQPRGRRAHRALPAVVAEVGRAVGRDRVGRRRQNWNKSNCVMILV